jgi:hypothetical protein
MMNRHYDTLLETEREGFTVIVDKTWEDLNPADMFDDGIDPDTGLPYYDIEQMCRDIDSGKLDWFMLRVRVLYDGVELGTDYVGGFLYEDAREVLEDGVVEDMIWTALKEAKQNAQSLYQKLQGLCAQMELDLVK